LIGRVYERQRATDVALGGLVLLPMRGRELPNGFTVGVRLQVCKPLSLEGGGGGSPVTPSQAKPVSYGSPTISRGLKATMRDTTQTLLTVSQRWQEGYFAQRPLSNML
jgi:hypothetical protein